MESLTACVCLCVCIDAHALPCSNQVRSELARFSEPEQDFCPVKRRQKTCPMTQRCQVNASCRALTVIKWCTASKKPCVVTLSSLPPPKPPKPRSPACPAPQHKSKGKQQQSNVFRWLRVLFFAVYCVGGTNPKSDFIPTFQGSTFPLPLPSISIPPTQKQSVGNSSKCLHI